MPRFLRRFTTVLIAALVVVAAAMPKPTGHPIQSHPKEGPLPVMSMAADIAAAPVATNQKPAIYGASSASMGRLSTVAMPTSNSPLQREVFGFVNASNLGDASVGYKSWSMSLLSTVAFFGLPVKPGDGTIDTSSTGWQVIYSQTMSDFVNAAHAAGTRVIVSLNAHGDVCGQLAPSSAQTTINIAVQQVQQHNLDGVNMNYEGNDVVCSNGIRARDEMTTFMKNLRAALPNSYIAIDTYTGSAEDNLEFFNITGIAPYVDAFFVMAYDMDFANYADPPLSCTSFCFNPMSPLNTYRFNVTSSMTQYTALVPSSQVILGQPYYGRRGCVADLTTAHQYPTPNTNFVAPTYQYASTVSSQTGVYNFSKHRDPSDGISEWDTWWDTDWNCNREQYFDDTYSLGVKFDLANQDNLRGVGFFTLDYAGGAPEAWNNIATHFTMIPGYPGNVAVCAGNGSGSVSWTPAPTRGGPITKYVVQANPGGATVTVSGTDTYANISGLTPVTSYTFTVRGFNANGAGLVATTNPFTPIGTPPTTSYFTWFDNATPGMFDDNVHLLNKDSSGTSVGCVTLTGKAVVPFTLAPGATQRVTFPPLSIGGPIVIAVNSGPTIAASQRVRYFQSFNEVWATPGALAATTTYINWFDKASPGMLGDNIHVVNPGGVAANVTVSLPNYASQSLSIAPGTESYVTFPNGTIGGPVKITSDQPVLSSQRVQYYQSFNEVVGRSPAQADTTSYFNWFDKASPGMVGDNIHLLNPGTAIASVTVSMPGVSPFKVALAGNGTQAYVSFAVNTIGGPVTVSSDQPVLASQRVQYYQSFNEVAGQTASQASTKSYLSWFDKATVGMVGDNIHVVNPGTSVSVVTVTVLGSSTQLTLAPGMEGYVTFPANTIGGPVTITATQPVLAAQRVQYFQSFNEVSSG